MKSHDVCFVDFMSSVSKVKKLDCTYMITEKEFEYALMKFKRENGESNGQLN